MNIIFHASAGTGKTYQVTNLYASLLLGLPFSAQSPGKQPVPLVLEGESIEPSRILLMTFTDNAAAELRIRIAQLMLKARHEAEARNDAEAAIRIIRIMRALPAAPICTIHSFCAGLLRQRALDAGLSPAFSVLDQEESEQMLDEIARAELLARLQADSPSGFDPHFKAFCESERVMGGSGVAHTVCRLIHDAAGRGLDLSRAESMLPSPAHSVRLEEFFSVLEAMKRVRAEKGGRLPDKAAGVFQALEEMLEKFPTIGKNAEKVSNHWKNSELEDFVERLRQHGSLKFTGGNGLTELSRTLNRLVQDVTCVVGYRLHYDRIKAFARYAAAVASSYAKRKKQLGALDFDDLLTHAGRLLAGGRPRDERMFDYVIVDEVQDTSRVQCEIIRRLWDPAASSLIICGDTKQSIYAWRNADPRVMPDLAAAIRETDSSHAVMLQDSYRSKDALLDFVNPLFARVYGKEYGENERLMPAPSKNSRVREQGETACVEFLAAPWDDASIASDEEAPGIESRTRMEMTAIARRIKLLVEGTSEWQPRFRYSEDGDCFAPVADGNRFRYSDILVLLRRTSHRQVLEHVFHKYNIPYRIGGKGQGLFSRPEARDVLLYLNVLTRPYDAISLVGFLRSPWIGLSDESILTLGWSEKSFAKERLISNLFSGEGEKMLAAQEAAGSPHESQSARLSLARSLVLAHRAETGIRPASELVRELIELTSYDAVISGSFRGAQRLANMRKLIDWLRRAEKGGPVLPADIASLLAEHIEEPPDEPEAALLDPDQNTVTIMTIHGAKGLTSRVVFVPELSARPLGSGPWAFFDGEPEPVLHIRTEDIARNDIMSPGFDDARERAKAVREAESKNLLYVAMTRARDLLVLSGATNGGKPAEWRKPLDELLEDEPAARDLVRIVPYAQLEQAAQSAVHAGTSMKTEAPVPELFRFAEVNFSPGRFTPDILRYPATALSSAALSGAVEDTIRQRDGEEEVADSDGVDAAAFGTAGHQVLEQLAPLFAGDPALALNAASPLSSGQIEALRNRLIPAIERMKRETAGSSAVQVEWQFALLLEQDETKVIVDGAVDIFFRTSENVWRIIDYKFTDESESELRRRYGLQLNLYRIALARHLATEAQIATQILAIGQNGVSLIDIAALPDALETAVSAARKLATEAE